VVARIASSQSPRNTWVMRRPAEHPKRAGPESAAQRWTAGVPRQLSSTCSSKRRTTAVSSCQAATPSKITN
jgi:hypothetical protein